MKNTVKEDKEAVKKECQKDKGKVKAKAAELTTPDQLVPNLKVQMARRFTLGLKAESTTSTKTGTRLT